ncbi:MULTISPECIES: alanine racemase [unclassified Roseitalea]|uniref:alanine racemase n=1 Tax=unclassified Roseitalea TaxID=2639107 RepID=UPI00273F2773|nr:MULTISPECIES: alanine racemase [unclassified Roseitalea]
MTGVRRQDDGAKAAGTLAGGRLSIDRAALAANWRRIAAHVAPAECAGVVKANAYGLGARAIVPALAEAGCATFFVALPCEGRTVRAAAPKARIFMLSGIAPEWLDAAIESELVPVLGSVEQAALWAERGGGRPCGLQVDTGMNRLGLRVDEALALASHAGLRAKLTIVHVMSHFACAEQPDHPMNRAQMESFQPVLAAFSGIESSFSNSAATLFGGAFGCSMVRPGIALYGGGDMPEAIAPMRNVVTLEGRIMQIRTARAGETVSYGATQTLGRDTTIAVVAVGYADGYPRAGSGTGVPLRMAVPGGLCGVIAGLRAPVLGRVTMDLTAFDVTEVPHAALEGGWIELIGPHMPLDDVARACGTIGYELLTSLGPRYARDYLPASEE